MAIMFIEFVAVSTSEQNATLGKTTKGGRMSKVVVLLPALNEEQTIGNTIRDIRKFLPDDDILVIDNASTDKTTVIANKMGATVLTSPKRGKGRAIRDAIDVLRISPKLQADYCIMMDSDFTYPAKHIPAILKELENGADVVMGYRNSKDAKSMSLLNSAGNVLLSLLAGALYGYRPKDLCTGMWGFRKEATEKFDLISNGFTLEANLFSSAMRTKCRVKQIPISYRARPDGSKAKLKIKDGFRIGGFLIKERVKMLAHLNNI